MLLLLKVGREYLESVDFELVRFGESALGEPLTDIFSLITLELQNFTIFRVLNDSAITSELLKMRISGYRRI